MIRDLLINQKIWDKLAILDQKHSITYHDLAGRAYALYAQLPQNTESPIAIVLPNSSDYLPALFGVLMAGLTALPLNVAQTSHEIEPILVKTKVHTIITHRNYHNLLIEINHPFEIIYMEDMIPWDGENLPDIAAVEVDPNLPMVLISTSGTTDKAKIVMLSENNLNNSVCDYLDRLPEHSNHGNESVKSPHDNNVRFLLGTPFSSVYGVLMLSVMVRLGASVALIPNPMTLDIFLNTIDIYQITHYEGGAAAAILMEQCISRTLPYDISSTHYFCFGGSSVLDTTMQKLRDAYPHAVFWSGYGMTESPLIAKPTKYLPEDKASAVGIAGKNAQLIIELDGQKTCNPFVQGEIIYKSPSVMLGYFQNKQDTDQTIKDGWLYTGDLGYLDEEGYLYICGRIKNSILVRGFTVFPEEVEASILNSKLAKECIVYSKKDSFGSEIVCADIIPYHSEILSDDIIKWCQNHLADYKQPQKIRIVQDIPKNPSGKVTRIRKESP